MPTETTPAPRTTVSDRVLNVYMHNDEVLMTVPRADWMWQLRYADEPNRPRSICSDRMMAAGVCEDYRYLIMECTKDEAWHRIKLLRAAVKEHDHA